MIYNPTRHALMRMDQRGFNTNDIRIILENGTFVRRGFRVLRDRDADAAIRRCKRQIQTLGRQRQPSDRQQRDIRECKRRIQTLERLRGSGVVVEDGTLVTCLHISGAQGRRALRGRPRRRHRVKPRHTR